MIWENFILKDLDQKLKVITKFSSNFYSLQCTNLNILTPDIVKLCKCNFALNKLTFYWLYKRQQFNIYSHKMKLGLCEKFLDLVIIFNNKKTQKIWQFFCVFLIFILAECSKKPHLFKNGSCYFRILESANVMFYVTMFFYSWLFIFS